MKFQLLDDAPGGSTPSQYGLPEGATDLQDLIEHRRMNFAIGNILKAAYRMGTCDHSEELRDLRKIIWFAEREINRIEKAQAASQAILDHIQEIAPEKSEHADVITTSDRQVAPGTPRCASCRSYHAQDDSTGFCDVNKQRMHYRATCNMHRPEDDS